MNKKLLTLLFIGGSLVACQPKKAETPVKEEKKVEIKEAGVEELKGGRIVYVNIDSLLTNFKLAEKYTKILREETVRLQTELAGQEKQLYAEVEQLKRQAVGMSQFEVGTRQRKLAEKEQGLLKLRDTYTYNLAQQEEQYNIEVNDIITGYLNRYCEDKPIDMVLSYSRLGMIRWARKGFDITDEVLEGLNEEYEEREKEEQKSK